MDLDKAVLVIEGEDGLRGVMAAALAQRGYRALQAGSGAEASATTETEPLHLIILGSRLQDTDALRWLAGIRVQGNYVRVIVLSEIQPDLETTGKLVRELDVALVLHRLVDAEVLGEQVERLIGRSRPPRESRQKVDLSETLAELGAEYGRRLPGKLDELAQALTAAREAPREQAPREQAHSLSHRIKGTAGSYGFAPIGDEARRIERALDSMEELGPAGAAAAWQTIEQALAAARSQLAGSALAAPAVKAGGFHVLLIDDDVRFAREAAALARQWLARITQVASAGAAIEAVLAAPPDAVILSLDLGSEDGEAGFALARQLRGLPGCAALPLAFVSSSGAHRIAAARRGASLYLVKPLSADALGTAIQHLMSLQHSERPHILLVDDDAEFAVLAATILRSEDLRVTALQDPAKLVDSIDRVRPDLLLLDMKMPGIDGLDVCRVLRATLEWQTLPILFLTSETGAASRAAAYAAGADDYLLKPILKEEFLARIKVRVERARLLRDRAERDVLTGLLLRRSFLEGLGVRLAEARHHRLALSLCLLEVERLQAINERHGYLAGDGVLADLGRLLAARLRPGDLRGRWGGSRLILAVPGSAAGTTGDLVGRLREEMQGLRFSGEGGESFCTSLSTGIASFPEDGDDVEALLRVAEGRLRRGPG